GAYVLERDRHPLNRIARAAPGPRRPGALRALYSGGMKLGTRVTVVTTVVVAGVLAASGVAALKARRADLEADLLREARQIAAALRGGLEPLDADQATETLEWRAYSARENREIFQLEILRVRDEKRTDDPAWLLLMQAAEIEDGPVGRLFDS